jgi:hypothetical protein
MVMCSVSMKTKSNGMLASSGTQRGEVDAIIVP